MRRAGTGAALAAGLLAGLLFTLAGGCGEQARPPGAARYSLDGALAGRPPARGPRPNVLLVLIDTLRADAVEPVGSAASMPFLSRFAREGVSFRQASAPAPWTIPSVGSLLTGRLPSGHGLTGDTTSLRGLAPLATWAEILRTTLGYATTAWLGEDWPGGPGSLFEGFEEVVPSLGFQGALEQLPAWARERRGDRPWFLLVHTFEAHDPYGAANHPYPWVAPSPDADPVAALGRAPDPALLAERALTDLAVHDALMRRPAYGALKREHVRYLWSGLRRAPDPALAARLHDAYLAGARWVDGLLEALMRRFAEHGLLDDTLVIVTSDHGEAFGEHGMLGHGRELHEELLRVPLALQGPGPFRAPRLLDASVSLLDLMPTVLEWLGLPPPERLDGRSLLPLLEGGGAGRPVPAQETRTPMRTALESHAVLESVRSATWKLHLVYDVLEGTVTESLHDLRTDPGERTDLLASGPPPAEVRADAAFVEAVEAARDRLWRAVETRRGGAGVAPVRAARGPRWAP